MGIDQRREPRARGGPRHPGDRGESYGSPAHLVSARVRVATDEGGRDRDRKRGADRDVRAPAQELLDGRCGDDAAADAEQTRQHAGGDPDHDAENDLLGRHRKSSAARARTSRSPRYAARLSARSSGNQRISSISSSRSSTSPPTCRIKKKCTRLRIRTSSQTEMYFVSPRSASIVAS